MADLSPKQLLRAGGVPVDVVARQLRHKDTRMVQKVYGRLTAEQTGEVMAKALPPIGGETWTTNESAERVRTASTGTEPEQTTESMGARFTDAMGCDPSSSSDPIQIAGTERRRGFSASIGSALGIDLWRTLRFRRVSWLHFMRAA